MDFEDRLVFFRCGALNLAGILTIPTESNGVAVLIPWGGGAYPSSGRNRIRARLARSLADKGFHAFRFDYQGVGESEGRFRERSLDEPYVEDIVAASSWLASEGHSRLVIIGHCLGGWSSLMAAPRIPGLEALAVINVPVGRDHIGMAARNRPLRWWVGNLKRVSFSKLRTPEGRARYRKMIGAKASAMISTADRVDTPFADAVRWLVDGGIALLLLYGEGGFRSDFDAEMNRGLGELIERAVPPTQVRLVDDRLGAYATLSSQETLLREIIQWIGELPVLVHDR